VASSGTSSTRFEPITADHPALNECEAAEKPKCPRRGLQSNSSCFPFFVTYISTEKEGADAQASAHTIRHIGQKSQAKEKSRICRTWYLSRPISYPVPDLRLVGRSQKSGQSGKGTSTSLPSEQEIKRCLPNDSQKRVPKRKAKKVQIQSINRHPRTGHHAQLMRRASILIIFPLCSRVRDRPLLYMRPESLIKIPHAHKRRRNRYNQQYQRQCRKGRE
jgi:hypothetical protein